MSDAVPQPPVAGPPWLPGPLNDAGVSWCLLRHAPDAPAGNQDVDLLVAPQDHAAATAALRRAGYVSLVTPGRGKDRFFLRYDAAMDAWPKLDVVTRLAFGPNKEVVTPLGDVVLDRRRQWDGGMWTPTDDDAFWSLLLHALLDKPRLLEHHRQRLALLAPAALSDGPFAAFIRDSAGRADAPVVLRGHAMADRWETLESLAPRLLSTLRRRRRVATWGRRQFRRVQRRADRSGLWPATPALFFAVVGSESQRQNVIAALETIPLPLRATAAQTTSRMVPAEAVVVTAAPPADVTLIVGAGDTPVSGGGRAIRLDAGSSAADLHRQVSSAVWTALVAGRAGAT